MNSESIRQLLKNQPFEPFEIRMSNGESHRISHPEVAFVAGSRIVLHYPDSDRMVILSLLYVSAIEMLQSA